MSGHTPLPWDVVPGNQNHGPYITTAFGTTVCDLYAMSHPISGEPKAVWFTDAALNAELIVRAVNAHDELLKALKSARTLINHMGDALNGIDAVSKEDVEFSTPIFQEIDAAIARATAHTGEG